jgi:CheY-like chemotaxis protein
MDGDIRLESTLGIGSRFTFTVPLGATAAPLEGPRVALTGAHILIVDPNPLSRAHVSALLRAHEADVNAVGDAMDACALLTRARATAVNAVVVNPPARNGGSEPLVTALRAVRQLADVPFVGLVTRLHVRGDAVLREFAVTVPKPIKRHTLVAALASVLPSRAAAAAG